MAITITDEDSARSWLETQSDQQVHTALAARAALRATPAIGEEFGEALAWVALPVLRAAITASVVAVVLPGRTAQTLKTSSVQAAEIAKEAADSAYSEANSAARCSSHAAFTAGGSNTLSSASSAIVYSTAASGFDYKTYRENRSVVYSACDWDADYLTSNRKDEPTSKSIFYRPLWPSEALRDFPTGEPLGFVQRYAKLTEFFDGNPDTWGFWKRWLEGMRTGQPLEWALQEQIALIPDEFWKDGEDGTGPEKIAKEIRARTLTWAVSRVRVQEKLRLDPEADQYTAIPIDTPNPERLKRHLQRVEDLLDDIIALGGANGLTENTGEYLIIKRLVAKYSEDPERVAFDLREVSRGIERQIDTGEFADDEPIRRLQAAAIEGVTAITVMSPEIAAELVPDTRGEAEKPDPKEVLVLEAAMLISSSLMTRETAQTTEEDAAEILHGTITDAARGEPTDAFVQRIKAYRASVLRRQVSRLAQIARDVSVEETFAKVQDVLAVHYDQKTSKAAGVVARYSSVAILLYHAVSILGRMLGLGT